MPRRTRTWDVPPNIHPEEYRRRQQEAFRRGFTTAYDVVRPVTTRNEREAELERLRTLAREEIRQRQLAAYMEMVRQENEAMARRRAAQNPRPFIHVDLATIDWDRLPNIRPTYFINQEGNNDMNNIAIQQDMNTVSAPVVNSLTSKYVDTLRQELAEGEAGANVFIAGLKKFRSSGLKGALTREQIQPTLELLGTGGYNDVDIEHFLHYAGMVHGSFTLPKEPPETGETPQMLEPKGQNYNDFMVDKLTKLGFDLGDMSPDKYGHTKGEASTDTIQYLHKLIKTLKANPKNDELIKTLMNVYVEYRTLKSTYLTTMLHPYLYDNMGISYTSVSKKIKFKDGKIVVAVDRNTIDFLRMFITGLHDLYLHHDAAFKRVDSLDLDVTCRYVLNEQPEGSSSIGELPYHGKDVGMCMNVALKEMLLFISDQVGYEWILTTPREYFMSIGAQQNAANQYSNYKSWLNTSTVVVCPVTRSLVTRNNFMSYKRDFTAALETRNSISYPNVTVDRKACTFDIKTKRIVALNRRFAYGYRPDRHGGIAMWFFNEKVATSPTDKLYFGIELESSLKEHYHSMLEPIINLIMYNYPQWNNFVLATSDTSIDCGTEYVFKPMIPEVALTVMDLWINNPFFKECYRKHTSCGNHIHVNAGAFNPMSFAKWYKFFGGDTNNRSFIDFIAERISDHYSAHYNKELKDGLAVIVPGAVCTIDERLIAKYRAINIATGRGTYEVRVFQSRPDWGVLKNIEFVWASIRFATFINRYRLSSGDFIHWLMKYPRDFPNLVKFILSVTNVGPTGDMTPEELSTVLIASLGNKVAPKTEERHVKRLMSQDGTDLKNIKDFEGSDDNDEASFVDRVARGKKPKTPLASSAEEYPF